MQSTNAFASTSGPSAPTSPSAAAPQPAATKAPSPALPRGNTS